MRTFHFVVHCAFHFLPFVRVWRISSITWLQTIYFITQFCLPLGKTSPEADWDPVWLAAWHRLCFHVATIESIMSCVCPASLVVSTQGKTGSDLDISATAAPAIEPGNSRMKKVVSFLFYHYVLTKSLDVLDASKYFKLNAFETTEQRLKLPHLHLSFAGNWLRNFFVNFSQITQTSRQTSGSIWPLLQTSGSNIGRQTSISYRSVAYKQFL